MLDVLLLTLELPTFIDPLITSSPSVYAFIFDELAMFYYTIALCRMFTPWFCCIPILLAVRNGRPRSRLLLSKEAPPIILDPTAS